ncbi:MAG TPA: cytochrome c oxidase subunit II [Verrucomicrobiae bacterium]|jgi:cytochrome c oxidase subunit 2
MKFPIFPTAASTTATHVDTLFWFLCAMSVFFILLIFIPMFFFLFKYRRGKPANRAPLRISTLKIEMTWTLIPLGLLIVIFVWSSSIYYSMAHVPPAAMEINVVGKQWMWKIQHAEGNREINELHVPVGQTIKLNLASQDVIHSFYLPEFRIKQDVVPGRYRAEWFTATKVGTFRIFCAEYCGTVHSGMIGKVIVMPPDKYQRWLSAEQPPESLVKSGERLFRELGCSGCHMGNSQVRAPRLEGLYGRPVPLSNGQFVRGDEAYIRDSILLPQSQIAAGYEPLMPTFAGRVSEEEIMELIAYIKSLRPFKAEVKP